MKISNYMNNTNSIMEKNTDKVQKGNSQTNEKHTVGQSVKLSISNEGLEYYRNRIQQSGQEKYDDVVQRKELLASKKISDIDYSYEIQKKAAQQNQPRGQGKRQQHNGQKLTDRNVIGVEQVQVLGIPEGGQHTA